MPLTPTDDLVRKQLAVAADRLRQSMNQLEFDEPVSYIYNPLDYAWDLHRQYIELASGEAEVLFLGMNPGPWGMAQTGVPFGEIATVRDWLGISGDVCEVDPEHPKRPIEGLDCERSEVSGRRLWGLMRERYPTPQDFFRKHFVVNYCPLVFMEESGRNRTPDKLSVDERQALQVHCDQHLQEVIRVLPWKHLVGVGAFAETCLKRVAASSGSEIAIGRILHPSPASPAANKDWSGTATSQLVKMGIWQ
ncbi:single-strand selective monofunctional uracil DNA glycosylase [Neorhodopirellula lusitana]|uniref:Single-strand selective monofunctional uracil DNA glycosylase n=2 Tax=Neorhodopirellula lusitana TaxID=445327 RepID=A0ABY1Q5S6_9BACT|nr:uracil-DNA glycosylase family protein [Neorhodopirellula lusitana]SMP58858.1 single-strand selective monofunctional uracil DNA glycosylase [Neorhodopirellula lusitana]